MDCPDRADDRTFRVNFSAEGISSLREKVKEKLKEYMGDYTDDTLVEYVIVLLRNGRRKEEARNELNVFLGDDSASFISWLWDHLASNVNSYVQVPVHPDEVINHKSKHQKQMETGHVDSESEMAEPSKYARSRHNREWKGLIRDADEPLLLRSSNIDNNESGEKNHHKSNYENRSLARSKRNRLDDRHQPKRQSISQATIDAPRRLLQFAVRDAVGTSKSFSLAKELTSEEEPKLKRLRSVVSTPVGEPSVNDQPRRIKSVARVPNATAVAIKAVAEAAEDVGKVGSSRNVFDRLGRAIDVSDASEQLLELKGVRNNDNDRINYILGEPQTCYNDTELVDDTTMLDHTMPLASDYLCNNEGYVSGIMGLMDGSEMTTSGRKKEGASIMQRDLANITYGVVQKSRNKDLDRAVAAENMGHKMGYVPVNVDAWKLPHCRVSMEVSEIDRRKSLQQSGVGTGKLGAPPVKENSNTVAVSNGNAKSVATIQKESQGTLTSPPSIPSTCRPLEDADLRTIFLNNVHFAATKDSLSRHFNKFGEVLKVVIVTDATTGQPKGSAFVEFMRKEAADGALTLDGTSFMSRILKIARKGCTQQESGPSIVAWPRVHRGAPFSLSRFPGIPFPRGGVPGRGFRPRPPVKVGARSMQWKRDGQPAPESGSAVSGNSLCLPAGRTLTYVRKTDGSS